MMEAPEAINIASQRSDTVKGKRITVAEALDTPHKFTFFNGEPGQGEERLTGRVITGVRHYGGMVHIEAEDTRLILSEGVNIRLYGPGEELPKKHQLLIGFTDESCIVVSVRMYGAIWCYPDGELAGNLTEYFEAARDKPQVLSDDFTEEYFNSLIGSARMRNNSAKAALATDLYITGLGNGVLQAIFDNAGIHP